VNAVLYTFVHILLHKHLHIYKTVTFPKGAQTVK